VAFALLALVDKVFRTAALTFLRAVPTYARRLREQIESQIPHGIGEILERLGSLRGELMQRIPTQEKRQAAYEEILGWLLADHNKTDNEVIGQIIGHYETEADE
jgi:hypothetical protein